MSNPPFSHYTGCHLGHENHTKFQQFTLITGTRAHYLSKFLLSSRGFHLSANTHILKILHSSSKHLIRHNFHMLVLQGRMIFHTVSTILTHLPVSSFNLLWKPFSVFLFLNLSKLNIVVFRNGGHLALREKWFYDGTRLAAVNQYEYLGMIFSTGLIFSFCSVSIHYDHYLYRP